MGDVWEELERGDKKGALKEDREKGRDAIIF